MILDANNTTDASVLRKAQRDRILAAAASLLEEQGPEALTTRSVAAAAGVQAPTLYRLFGDKDGLVAAVVAHGLSSHLVKKQHAMTGDAVADLQAGWDLTVGFALENPELYLLMHDAARGPKTPEAANGENLLRQRIRAVAAAGRLRVSEHLAFELMTSAATGALITTLRASGDNRNRTLIDAAWHMVLGAILMDAPIAPASGVAGAAVALKASLQETTVLSPGESMLLVEWLVRLGAN